MYAFTHSLTHSFTVVHAHTVCPVHTHTHILHKAFHTHTYTPSLTTLPTLPSFSHTVTILSPTVHIYPVHTFPNHSLDANSNYTQP